LVSNIKLANAGTLQVWKIDMETGNGTLLIEDNFYSALNRIDHINVLGDVNNNATIWAASSESEKMYRWSIFGGMVDIMPDEIKIDFSAGGFPAGVTNPGIAVNCFPVTENLVYLSGTNIYPTLLHVSGTTAYAVDGFYDFGDSSLPIPDAIAIDNTTIPGVSMGMQENINGFAQFMLGDDMFFAMPVRNHMPSTDPLVAATPFQSFRLFKYKDEDAIMREAETLWTFPAAGLGPNPHSEYPYYVNTVAASVDDDQKATIYVYSGNNGIAAYEFDASGSSGIKYPNAANIAVYSDNKTIQFSETVASAQIFGITGQLTAKASNTASVSVALPGVYLVKATASNGETVVSKVIVK